MAILSDMWIDGTGGSAYSVGYDKVERGGSMHLDIWQNMQASFAVQAGAAGESGQEKTEQQENWCERVLANAQLSYKEIPPEERSSHHLLVQENGQAEEEGMVPYSARMKGGMIVYHGVTFQCNPKESSITLGDMSNPKDVIMIPLSGGGVLKVNYNNLDELAQALGMFSAEDLGNILRAVATFQKARSVEMEIEEEENASYNQLAQNCAS